MSELEVRNLVKRSGKDVIVDHVSFRITDDEFFVLLGPSGSGKSTIVSLICGFDQPDEGHILINGEDVTKSHTHYRNVGVVFQDYGLFPTMNVFDNIAYSLQTRHMPRKEIELRVLMATEMLGLKDVLKRSLTNLSGGELQRVSLARVLVKDAEAYLFDEPLSQLDPRTRYRTRQEIMMIHRLKSKPSVYITHDQNEAFAMANRIAVIGKGKILQVGTPDELLYTPQTLFVAQFIGDPPINIFEGYIQHIETRYRLRCDGMLFTLPTRWTNTLARLGPQSKVLLGLRPNMIIPEWDFHTLGTIPHTIVRAQIIHIESAIGKMVVRLTIGHNTTLRAEFDDTHHTSIQVGQVINIAINIENVSFFNPYTEELLNKNVG